MPDVWTYNPPMLREALEASDIACGREARVLKPRDPYWTCHVDKQAWTGDIYIHYAGELGIWPSSVVYLMFLAMLLLGVLTGMQLQKRT